MEVRHETAIELSAVDRAGARLRAHWQPLLVLTIAGVVTLWGVGSKSFWLDEGASAWMTKVDWEGFFRHSLGYEPNFGLYYLTLRIWSYVAPDSEAGLRFLSVIGYLVGVLYTYRFGELVLRRHAGLLAGLLMSVSSFGFWFAQEARPYTWAMALGAASWFHCARWCSAQRRRDLWLWIVTILLGGGMHLFVFLMVPAQLLTLVPRRGIPTRDLRVGLGAMAVVSLPFFVLVALSGADRVAWIPDLTGAAVTSTFVGLSGGSGWLAIAFLVGACPALLSLVRREWRGADARGIAASLAWLLVPMSMVIFESLLFQPLWTPRYFVVSLPAAMLLVGAGLARLDRRVAVATLCILMAASILQVTETADVPKENWRSAMAYVAQVASRGDEVLVVPFGRSAASYYLAREDVYDDMDVYDWGAFTSVPSVRRDVLGSDKVWMVVRSPGSPRTEKRRRNVASAWDLRQTSIERFGGIRVLRFERIPRV